jgi:steroid delta-isomerase-like uncharacterized protein
MTTIEQNKTIVREFIDELFTKGDLGAVDVFLAEDFVNHDPPFGATADREGMRAAGAMFRAAFPDWHTDPGLLIGEGDLVVEQFTASGTQRGEIMGAPATGRTVTLNGINVWPRSPTPDRPERASCRSPFTRPPPGWPDSSGSRTGRPYRPSGSRPVTDSG